MAKQRTVILLSPEANKAAKARAAEKGISLSKHLETLIWGDARETGLAGRLIDDGEVSVSVTATAGRAAKAMALMEGKTLTRFVEDLVWVKAKEKGIAGEFLEETSERENPEG